MAAIRDVNADSIDAARRSVIELTFEHQTTARVARKQAVKELFGTLLASWEAGVPFAKMATALNTCGIQITPDTLRSYFFELKTADQLRAGHAEHERAMDKIRKENETRQRAKDLLHARELTQAGTDLVSNAHDAKVTAASQVATQAVEAARIAAGQPGPAIDRVQRGQTMVQGASKIENTTANALEVPPSAEIDQAPVPPMLGATSASARKLDRPRSASQLGQTLAKDVSNVGNESDPVAKSQIHVETDSVPVRPEVEGVKPTTSTPEASASAACARQEVHAKTLDEVARISQGRKETPYTENLVLREGDTVWFETGKPFDGYLSPRTIHTLRNIGRVIAPTEGRTARDFVAMSHEL